MREPKVDIICELGINHDGNFGKALDMINAAKNAGVKIVKFQHYDALKLLGPDSPYLAYASKCQFTKYEHEQLASFCNKVGMEYLVSVFDIADIPWADGLCKRHKVASRMNKDEAFIQALLDTGKEVIFSTQSTNPFYMPTVRYMYCITKYPTPEKEMKHLPCNVHLGLSSHCPSIKPSIAAYAQGADLIEHHVTFSREDEGCDHSSSITFDELHQLNLFVNKLEVLK
jgi:N,N'-diacetyllegionaminate synthase